ncbi:MAG: YHYH protein [Bacteroidota bacterium]
MRRYQLFFVALLSLSMFIISCGEDSDGSVDEMNVSPEVSNPIQDQNLSQGFQSSTINLADVFTDADGDDLNFSAVSSPSNVVTVAVSGNTLTITEVGVGSAIVTVTASDGNGGSVRDEFNVFVNASGNNIPTVSNAISDQNLIEGFQSSTIDLANVFADEDGDNLSFSATSSSSDVVTVSISGATLTLSEAGVGNATVTVTASDGKGGSISDEFNVSIQEEDAVTCDYTVFEDRDACDNDAGTLDYTETVSGSTRNVRGSGIPNHDYGNQFQDFPDMDPNSDIEVTDQNYNFNFTANPQLATSQTSILNTNTGRPEIEYGVAVNAVPIDPAPAEPFIFENPNTGEYNWDWVFEPNNNKKAVGLDCAVAHVQPDGAYHYHGDMAPLADFVSPGISCGVAPTSPAQIGWAADGYPIIYRYGPTASGDGIELLEPSYRLKSGSRPGDGVTEPDGTYDGQYTNDYEYVDGLGDLDECNGIERSITITTNAGSSETFDYFYVITEDFPIIGRCLSGTPDDDFFKRP